MNQAEMQVELLSYTKNPVETMCIAASTCYDSIPNVKILKHCYNSGHLSVFEHASFTFKITGVSRALLAQITRHRMASFSVMSQRYVDMSNAEFIYPKTNYDSTIEIYDDIYSNTLDSYIKLQQAGEKNENARFALPNACSTNIVMTMNLRELCHFMNERLCATAQWEIRNLAKMMKQCVISCEDIQPEFIEFLTTSMLVPKCIKSAVHFCPESKSRCCGRCKTATEINEILIKQ